MTQINHLTGIIPVVATSGRARAMVCAVNRSVIAAAIIVVSLALHGCAARQPGAAYPWTSHHSAVGGDNGITTYIGIGRTF